MRITHRYACYRIRDFFEADGWHSGAIKSGEVLTDKTAPDGYYLRKGHKPIFFEFETKLTPRVLIKKRKIANNINADLLLISGKGYSEKMSLKEFDDRLKADYDGGMLEIKDSHVVKRDGKINKAMSREYQMLPRNKKKELY